MWMSGHGTAPPSDVKRPMSLLSSARFDFDQDDIVLAHGQLYVGCS